VDVERVATIPRCEKCADVWLPADPARWRLLLVDDEELVGHADAGFTLRVYARDGRDTAAVVEDVLARAAGANVGA
jgi:hypothetical protein